jgi:hypothetical protein
MRMWLWIGLASGAFIALSLLIALAFARVVATLNGDMIELLEDQPASHSPVQGVSDRQPSGRREPLSRASATR